MMQEELIGKEKGKVFPPYIPWQTFTTLIDRFKSTAVPSRIDSSIMSSLSGTTQGQLKSALRFLHLTDAEGHATEKLKTLVQAYKTDQWQPILSEVISHAYASIVNSLDITSATVQQLKDRFRVVGGVEGATVDRSTRFYLATLKEAGVPFSPYFASRRGKSAGNRRALKRPTKAKSDTILENHQVEEKRHEQPLGHDYIAHPSGTIKFPVPIPTKPNAIIIIPEDMTPEEWSMVDTFFRNYIELRHKAGQQLKSP